MRLRHKRRPSNIDTSGSSSGSSVTSPPESSASSLSPFSGSKLLRASSAQKQKELAKDKKGSPSSQSPFSAKSKLYSLERAQSTLFLGAHPPLLRLTSSLGSFATPVPPTPKRLMTPKNLSAFPITPRSRAIGDVLTTFFNSASNSSEISDSSKNSFLEVLQLMLEQSNELLNTDLKTSAERLPSALKTLIELLTRNEYLTPHHLSALTEKLANKSFQEKVNIIDQFSYKLLQLDLARRSVDDLFTKEYTPSLSPAHSFPGHSLSPINSIAFTSFSSPTSLSSSSPILSSSPLKSTGSSDSPIVSPSIPSAIEQKESKLPLTGNETVSREASSSSLIAPFRSTSVPVTPPKIILFTPVTGMESFPKGCSSKSVAIFGPTSTPIAPSKIISFKSVTGVGNLPGGSSSVSSVATSSSTSLPVAPPKIISFRCVTSMGNIPGGSSSVSTVEVSSSASLSTATTPPVLLAPRSIYTNYVCSAWSSDSFPVSTSLPSSSSSSSAPAVTSPKPYGDYQPFKFQKPRLDMIQMIVELFDKKKRSLDAKLHLLAGDEKKTTASTPPLDRPLSYQTRNKNLSTLLWMLAITKDLGLCSADESKIFENTFLYIIGLGYQLDLVDKTVLAMYHYRAIDKTLARTRFPIAGNCPSAWILAIAMKINALSYLDQGNFLNSDNFATIALADLEYAQVTATILGRIKDSENITLADYNLLMAQKECLQKIASELLTTPEEECKRSKLLSLLGPRPTARM